MDVSYKWPWRTTQFITVTIGEKAFLVTNAAPCGSFYFSESGSSTLIEQV